MYALADPGGGVNEAPPPKINHIKLLIIFNLIYIRISYACIFMHVY